MLHPTQFVKLVHKEINLICHIAKNITPEMLDYRPMEKMRSTQELMQYLVGCGYYYPAYWFTDGQTPVSDYFKNLRENQTIVSLENFNSLMQEQANNIESLVKKVADEDWFSKMVKYPWGETAPLGEALFETTFKWLTAYKYQLMMYAKMSGSHELGTKDVWVGHL